MAENVEQVQRIVNKIAGKHRNLQKGFGKKVIELQPAVEWHKGKALLWLLQALALDNAKVVPIYIGDDLTDENGFRAVLALAGVGILVGHHGQETAAKYRLQDVAEVRQFLNFLIKELG